jgi:VIT1/CCC1 family predicted Fe2+/Mn2+ transporter
MVVVQLAMGQFSPRIVQTILRDKPSQIAIGLFVATFVHAMLALRVSNGIAIVLLFVGGYKLAKFTGFHPWWTGLGMVAIGTVLVALTIALGG